jgi:hypothetical protein
MDSGSAISVAAGRSGGRASGDSQPPGRSASLRRRRRAGEMTSSPCCQFTGVATLSCAISCSESTSRRPNRRKPSDPRLSPLRNRVPSGQVVTPSDLSRLAVAGSVITLLCTPTPYGRRALGPGRLSQALRPGLASGAARFRWPRRGTCPRVGFRMIFARKDERYRSRDEWDPPPISTQHPVLAERGRAARETPSASGPRLLPLSEQTCATGRRDVRGVRVGVRTSFRRSPFTSSTYSLDPLRLQAISTPRSPSRAFRSDF